MKGEPEFLILDPLVPSLNPYPRLFVIAGTLKQSQKAETAVVFTFFLSFNFQYVVNYLLAIKLIGFCQESASLPKISLISTRVFVFLSWRILDSLPNTDSSYSRCPPSVHFASRISPIIV